MAWADTQWAGEGALIRSSTDGVHWTNGLSTIGIEHIHGIAYCYSVFVAVGSGDQINTSYILTSSNGLDWISRNAPTTNTLFGISPCFGAEGGWAEDLFVAVGERGTIITSTNGVDWVVRNSGTTATLRAVLFHRGMIALGDSGIVLSSSDGASWSIAAPASFNVRGAASSWDAIVAVGNYSTAGRLHVSTDGLTWPGSSTEFAQPLNAIAYGAGSFVAVGDGGLILQSGATNEWTRPTSAYWEQEPSSSWSLGTLPAITQDLVAFRNPGWKALTIGANTTANFPDSLSINNFIVDAPAGSFNELLLNYAGLDVPLSVASDFVLRPNGSLVSYYSALRGGNLYLSGPATLSEGSTAIFNKIELEANVAAELNLTNSSLGADLLILGPSGTVAQSGGSSQVSNFQMYAGSAYTLSDGTLIVSNLDLQSLGGTGLAQFTMASGSMDVQGRLRLGRGSLADPTARGEFLMQGGYFQSAELNSLNGSFTQSGGTNVTPTMVLPGDGNYAHGEYFLSGGTLVSSNLSVAASCSPFTYVYGNFVQSGGVHTNSAMSLYGYLRTQTVHPCGNYSLSAGLLVSGAMRIYGGTVMQSGGTNHIQELLLDGAGSFTLTGGELVTSNTTVDTCCCVRSDFVQSGGSHTVQNRLLLEDFVSYQLRAGTLTAANIEIGPGGVLSLQGGVISNSGIFTIRGGAFRLSGQTQELGPLQVLGVPASVCDDYYQAPGSLSLGSPWGQSSEATVLRFRDSHEVAWSGLALSVRYWRPSTNGFSGDHIFVGANAEGLTATQLSQLVFVDPRGWPQGSYPARMLPTGEVVPGVPPPLGFVRTSDSVVLSWNGDYQLITATNVTGPYVPVTGASSPLTNTFTEPQRYFQLRWPVP